MEMELAPSEIRYLHDSISACFRNKEYILDTFKDLLYRRLVPDDIPRISVFKWGDTWHIYHGHRRLYLYKSLQKQGVIDTVTVGVVPKKKVNWNMVRRKNTSKNGGKTVEIRNDDKFNGIKGQIVQEWRNVDSETESESEDSDCEYESDSSSDSSYYQYWDGDGDSDVDDLADQFGRWGMY